MPDGLPRDQVCLSSIDWGELWQGPHEIMTHFAERGSRILFVDNTGVRRPRRGDVRRILSRLRWFAAGPGGRDVPVPTHRITVVSPLVLPFPWWRWAGVANRALLARRLPGLARAAGLTRPVVWTFLPTPLAVDSVRAFAGDRALAVYYCVADFEPVSDDPAALRRSESDLLRDVDIVFAGGRVLERRFAPHHPRVVLTPYAVSDAFFGPVRTELSDLATIPRPRVAYVGGLHRHVDADLVAAVARALPDVHFVFIGPKFSGTWEAESLPNTHFIGRREHADVPAYLDASDVCIVPYRRSPFTETVWPTKLHEYLARGKPVVSTALPEVRLLDYPPTAVRISDGAADMAAAIRAALADTSAGADRRALAEPYSWARTLGRMNEHIERAIDARVDGRADRPA